MGQIGGSLRKIKEKERGEKQREKKRDGNRKI
jgi:hypothetical protein